MTVRRVIVAGAAALSLTATAGFYRVGRGADGAWTLTDPDGRPMTWLGVDHVKFNGFRCEAEGNRMRHREANIRRFVTRPAWATNTIGRLRGWGFNALGAGCDNADLRGFGFGRTVFLALGDSATGERGDHEHYLAENLHVPGSAFPNVFNPDFAAACEARAARICAECRDDREIMGYFLDNELAWEGRNRGATRKWGLFDAARAKPEGNSARVAVERFLAERGLKADDDVPLAVKEEFVGLVAERYFAAAAGAIRRHDPNHLVLGCRFAGAAAVADRVWAAAGRHCDIVTMNAYARAELDRNVILLSDGDVHRPIAETLGRVHALAGRPILLTEWSFPALDAGLPCTRGAGQRFDTQAERAAASSLYARSVLALPFVVGYDYFMWVDMPAKGISFGYPEDTNYGLVREDGEPYRELVAALAAVQRDVGAVRRAGVPPARPSARTAATDTADFIARHLPTGTNALPPRIRLVAGGRAPVERIELGGVNYGAFTAAAQLKRAFNPKTRSGHDLSTHPVTKVTRAEWTGRTLATTGEMPLGEGGMLEIDLDFTVAADSPRCVCALRAIRNVGAVEAPVLEVLLRPFAPFQRATANPKAAAASFYNRPRRARAWRDDKRFLGTFTDSVFLVDFEFWRDKAGNQHPDIRFNPCRPARGRPLTLKPGEAWVPEAGVCVLIEPGEGDADAWVLGMAAGR